MPSYAYGWSTRIKGVGKVMSRLNREMETIPNKSLKGLLMCAARIHRETESGAVRVPVDLGNLRHSWFVVSSTGRIQAGGGRKHMVEGGGGAFLGANAQELSAGHVKMLTEMGAKATYLSNRYSGPFVIMGYSANYALWVHEMIGENKEINWSRPKSGARWFEIAVNKHKDTLIQIVRDTAKIKRSM